MLIASCNCPVSDRKIVSQCPFNWQTANSGTDCWRNMTRAFSPRGVLISQPSPAGWAIMRRAFGVVGKCAFGTVGKGAFGVVGKCAFGAVAGYVIGVGMRAPKARFIIAYGIAIGKRFIIAPKERVIIAYGNAIGSRGNATGFGCGKIMRAESPRRSGRARSGRARHSGSVNPTHIVHRIVSGIFAKMSGIRPERSWCDDAPPVRRCI